MNFYDPSFWKPHGVFAKEKGGGGGGVDISEFYEINIKMYVF